MATALNPDLLAILCCPETHQHLTQADDALLARVNSRITAGQLTNRGGQPVTTPIEGGLLRDDGKILYPIRNRIPVLLIDEALILE